MNWNKFFKDSKILVMIKGGNIDRIGVVRPKVTNFQDWKGKLDKRMTV